jgi:branched-chain amino acid aminotransferase
MKRSSADGAAVVRPAFIWRNGEIVPWDEARVHVSSVGHASVSAVFEGIAAYWQPNQEQLYVFRLREHLQRLLQSLKIVRLQTRFSLDAMVQAVLDVLHANEVREDVYIRPWAFVEGYVRELISPADLPTELVIDMWPLNSRLLTERGCRACVSSWTRIGDNVLPPRAKAFSNYHNSRLAALEATAGGYDRPILLNDRHKVAEGPGACVALVRDATVITPTVASGLLESITRATFSQLFEEVLDIPVVEREVERTELYLADEVFYMGTGWEMLPVFEIDRLPVGDGRMGAITRAIDQAYHDVVRAVDNRYSEWRTAVWC